MLMYAAIDRIENNCAICETNSGMIDLFLHEIPFDVEERDVLLIWKHGGKIKVLKNDEKEKQRRIKKLRKLYERANLRK